MLLLIWFKFKFFDLIMKCGCKVTLFFYMKQYFVC